MGDPPRQLSQQLELIFDRHYELVYRTAYSLTGSPADAEDIVQTIFVRLLNRELPPDLSASPERYLYRAAFNLSLNVIRDRKRQMPTSNLEALDRTYTPSHTTTSYTTTSHTATEDGLLDRRLRAAIALLNPAAAQIVILRYVHDYDLAEIAQMLGTTRSTVAVSLFRSRSRLKKYFLEARKGGDHAPR